MLIISFIVKNLIICGKKMIVILFVSYLYTIIYLSFPHIH